MESFACSRWSDCHDSCPDSGCFDDCYFRTGKANLQYADYGSHPSTVMISRKILRLSAFCGQAHFADAEQTRKNHSFNEWH
jgi:hypothetical protein